MPLVLFLQRIRNSWLFSVTLGLAPSRVNEERYPTRNLLSTPAGSNILPLITGTATAPPESELCLATSVDAPNGIRGFRRHM
jgi:hypothetical protein